MNLRVGIVAAVLAASGAAGVSGFDCTRTVSRVTGGSTEGVVVIGDVAVLGFGATLLVADLADPARPAAMAELSFGEPGPHIWGLSGMTSDTWVAVRPVAAWNGHGIVSVDVHELFRARVATSLAVVDLTEPSAPVVVGAVDYGRRAFPQALEIIGQELYVGFQEFDPFIGGDDGGLEVFDLSDPATPSHRHSRDFSPGAVALSSEGGWLAAADPGRGLRLFMLDEDVGRCLARPESPAPPELD